MSRRKRDRIIDMEQDEIVESIECPHCGCEVHEQRVRCPECEERVDKNNGILGIF